MNPVIQIQGLQVHKGGRPICSVPELEIQPGERLVVTGANGAGKTTLLRVIAGLEFCEARALRITIPVESRVYVHQQPCLFRGSVRFNVSYGLCAQGMSRDRCIRLCDHWMDVLGVRGLAKRSAATLSGGERRRVVLARVLVLKPELLLLDEPFAELDEEGVSCVASALCESAATIVIASPLSPPTDFPSRTYALTPPG